MRESIPQRDRTRMGERSSRWSAGTDRPTHQTAKRDGIRAESRTQLQPKKSPGRDRSLTKKAGHPEEDYSLAMGIDERK